MGLIRKIFSMSLAASGFEYLTIRLDDQMFLKLAANFLVSSFCVYRELLGARGTNPDVEIHCERGGVEGRPEIGGGRRQCQTEPGWFRVAGLRGHLQSFELRRSL